MSRQAEAPAPPRRRFYHRCSCGRPIPEEVRRCSARTCPEYAPTWARDTRRRLFVNLEQLKLSVMFSVTAPGADLYPFDPRFCSHSPSQRCSGALGCRVDPELAEAFNRRAGKWWNQLNRVAKQRADRATRFKGKLACRVWEKQKRGLAHLHGVVSVESPAHVRWAEAYITALRELAPRYGFGFVDGWHKVNRRFWPGVQAAAYLSSYFAGGRGRKMAITENVLAGDLPRLVVFVGCDLTSQTGCTMRSLRTARATVGRARRPLRLPAPRPTRLADGGGDAQPLSDRVTARSRTSAGEERTKPSCRRRNRQPVRSSGGRVEATTGLEWAA
jgi:hypothetical protein